jgi:hypothetical protein
VGPAHALALHDNVVHPLQFGPILRPSSNPVSMKKRLQATGVAFLLFISAFAQTDFVPGANIIFQDDFNRDPVGDFPAKWNTSGEGQVVTIDDAPGKWLKISQPSAVSPILKKALPENCTIEFDLYLKTTTGVAPHIMFGLTSLSNVSSGDVYRKRISVKLERYNKAGNVVYNKNIEKLGEKKFALDGYIDRVLPVSISINKTRLRVYLDGEKIVDLPKLLTPEYRKNFFVASSVVLPNPEESVYISNVRIAEGDVDARSVLIKQLLDEGSVVTEDIQFTGNQLDEESLLFVNELGHTLQQDPSMEIQINTGNGSSGIINKDALKQKADKIKAYLVDKFRIKKDRILTDVNLKMEKVASKNKAVSKAKGFLTEIIRL